MGDGVYEQSIREVAGVVGNIKMRNVTGNPEPQYYLPFAQGLIRNPSLVARTAGDPAMVQNALRAAIHTMDPDVPVYQVSTLENYVSKSEAAPRFQTFVLTVSQGWR